MALELKKKDKPSAPLAPTKQFVPSLPSVNLLSQSVLDALQVKKLKKNFLVAAGVVVGLVLVVFGIQFGMVKSAESDLAAEKEQTAQLQTELDALAPIRTFYGQVDSNRGTIIATMSKEVLFSEVLSSVEEVIPNGVSLNNIAATADVGGSGTTPGAAVVDPATGAAALCPSPDPYTTTPAVGCITIDGEAQSRSDLGTMLRNVDESELFTEAFVSSTSTGEGSAITFSATVGLSTAVYEERYLDPTFLTGGNQ